MTTLWRSKHREGTKVTNDYLLLICNLLDQILYISFLIFRSYFLTAYSGRIRFADATSLFYCTYYAHEVICKLCGWYGNRWKAGGGRNPCPITPCSLLSLFARPWELQNFSTLAVPLRSALLPSWVLELWWCEQDGKSGTLAIWTRTVQGGSVSALPVCFLFQFSILDPGLAYLTSSPPRYRLVFGFRSIPRCAASFVSFLFHCTHFVLF